MGGTVSHYAESSGHAGQGGRGGEKHQNAVEKVMIYDEQKSSEGEGITEYNNRMDEQEEKKGRRKRLREPREWRRSVDRG